MSFFRNVLSVWMSLRSSRRRVQERGMQRPQRLEPLEVRTLLAGEFTDLGALGIPGVTYSSVAWGDSDNDGDLDVLVTGRASGYNPIAKVYRNNGDSTFTDLNAGLTGVYFSAVAWGDADNDGDLDILLTGRDGNFNPIAKVYRNNGNSTFTDINAGLTGVFVSAVAWGDYDNDGDLDILLTGRDSTGLTIANTKVYRNNGNSTFTDLNLGLAGVYGGSVTWGDADIDGDLDILLTGGNGPRAPIAKVYRNNGNSTFTDLNAGLTGVFVLSVGAWGDYDNDGDLDILLSGRDSGYNPIAKVYRNNGDSTFTDLNAGLTGVYQSAVAWGDADNDGDLDILLTGRDSTLAHIAKVYRNNGNSTFTDINAGLTGVREGSVVWGDLDNDGDLDILFTGRDSTSAGITKVYRNNAVTANTPPAAPTGLSTTVASSTSLTFSWFAAADTHTPAAGLSYNLRVGTTPGGSDVFSTMSNSANGFRRLPDAGPIQGTSYTLKNLTANTAYYWTVQAIDTAFAGGAFAAQVVSQPFTDLGALGIPGVTYSSVAWGDYDNDGDLDILLTGRGSGYTPIAKVYRNNGDSTFTDLNAGLTDVRDGSVAWGDYDNDGDLDILLTGKANGYNSVIAKVYRNNGNSTFTDLNAGLTGVFVSSVAWGDYDNDGDLDILLTGRGITIANIAKVYRNNGDSTFTDLNAGITGVDFSAVAWGDADNDGDLDILLTGEDSTNARIAKVYRNNGNSTFTDLDAGLTGVLASAVAWGDYDNDGDLDILLTGADSGSNPIAKVYRNNGNSTFTDLAAGLTGVYESSVSWGDYDNDGDLDILLTGRDSGSNPIARVYRNNGNSTFTDINAGLTGVWSSAVAWGDLDNDGDLDLILTGRDSGFNPIAKVYRNNALTANTPPAAPTGLSTTVASSTSLTFSWFAPADTQTPAAGLSYNLRVGTTPGGSDVFSTMASTATGTRRLTDAGPIQGTSYTLKNLTPNTAYYWTVQAIDTAFAGGAFAAQVVSQPFTDLGMLGTGVTNSAEAWGDYDNDGDLDLIITGVNSARVRIAAVYRNNGNSTFTDLNAGLTGVDHGAVAWGDYDNDGDLDIVLTGRDSTIAGIAKVYRNNGNSTFTDLNAGLAGVVYGAVAWGDADNDGDLDLLLTGVGSSAPIAKVYRNNGNSTFTDLNAGLTGVFYSAVAWGDYDRDGDLDFLVTGRDSTFMAVATVYRNNGNATFTNLNAGLTGVERSAVAWGDYDNDGDLDLVLTGSLDAYTQIAKVYRNDGNSTFTDINAGLPGVNSGAAAWGDADNDGDLDLLFSGNTDPTSPSSTTAKIYRNNGNNRFIDFNAGLIGVAQSSAVWGDADNDGDLDILLTGRDSGFNPIAKVYRNNALTANTPPAAPTNLTANVTNTALTFSWTAPADGQTPAAGLSYNLRVGTTPGGSNVFSTMANTTNGFRRIGDAGPIQGTSYTLKGLITGQQYFWSVQAIDTAFAGGAFAVEQSATTNISPAIGGVVANQPLNDTATIAPFAALTVTDPNNQNMFARVTILNGVARGDFTPATTTGWTRTVSGNDFKYERFYAPQANIGSVVQAAIRAFVFDPRENAIKPNTTELTDITLFVNDGLANATAATRLTTTSVNNAPAIGGTSVNVAVNDNATVNPLSTLTVNDADLQEMLISVTILNGTARGDFTPASTAGWAVRYVLGNNITYKRYFGPQANVGAAAQAAFRALVFQPRSNAINPGTTELTDFQLTVSDGVAPAVLGTGTRVTTTSVNDAPVISGAVANQTMNDNQTKAVFSMLTVTDPDTQGILARVTITNGTTRGDFTSASAVGWTRSVSGTNIIYNRYFNPAANNGAVVQAAVRALVFQPRNNVPLGTTETTSFTVFVNDGLVNITNSTTSVITTGVAPRVAPTAPSFPPLILGSDITTVVLPTLRKNTISPLARLLRKPR